MDARAQKNALFEAIALMGKAFAAPRRLELLDLLAQAPRTVDELARASSSTVRGACASRSSSSSRTGLAKALPISAIASNSASFSYRPLTVAIQ